ncbi:MAG: phosphoenolpyruvate mutase [Steroidobacteraceae bacterium]
MKKTAQFRKLLASRELEFLLEAHNGISARIGEEAGFKALWAGGLCLSAQYGVRDNNEASWTQVLEMLEFMADATRIPILLDGDTGYGNFNNVRRLVRKLEQRGVAAVCIEDKLFPKTNSFIDGDKQQLSDIDEFCSRIKAGKDAQGDDDFAIITRVEAFIAGWGLDEALKRAEAYHAAGSDGILIHSALSRPTEVLAFKKEWGDRLPVVIVPTRYHSTPTDVFREAGFSLAIWANHLLRAAVTAMQETAGTIAREQNLRSVEDRIAPVKELFRLQGASELQEAEERYLPKKPVRSRALILAASRGSELGELTGQRPKTMVKVRGRPLLSHIVSGYNAAGIKRIQVVRGYCAAAVDLPSLSYTDNDEYADSGELLSLAKGLAGDPDDSMDLFVSYGDVIFNHYILDALNEASDAFAIAVDTDWRESANRGRAADYVTCTQAHSRRNFYQQVYLEAAGEDLAEDRIHGEWMGFLRVASGSLPKFRAVVAALVASPAYRQAKMLAVLAGLMRQGERIRVIYTTGHWLDVDSLEDVLAASEFA